jgi:hypothetical protein
MEIGPRRSSPSVAERRGNEMTETSLLQNTAGALSRRAADRYSRRSFVGKVGRYGIAVTMGWAALEVLDPATALAHCNASCGACPSGCCGGANSRWCANAHSSSCPSGSCGCGSWCESVSTSTCGSGWRRVHDCCGGCGGCSSPNCDPCPSPTCCRHQTYRNGSCSNCGDKHIKCRRWVCASNCP